MTQVVRTVLRRLGASLAPAPKGEASDADLLGRFVRLRDEAAFELLDVYLESNKEELRKYLAREKVTWRVWCDDDTRPVNAYRRWQVDAQPTLFVIDARGVVRHHIVGYTAGKALDAAIAPLVREAEEGRGPKKD